MARWNLGRTLWVAGGLAGFAVPFSLTYARALPTPHILVSWPQAQQGTAPGPRTTSGRELLLVYVGASTCKFSNRPELPEAVAALRRELGEKARQAGMGFATLGIAKDTRVYAGMDHLNRFGSFDEIMTGRGWLNTGTVKYMFQDIPGTASTPQVLVLERYVERGNTTAIRGERLLVRKVGFSAIRQWSRTGAPLPRLEHSELSRTAPPPSPSR